MGKPTGFLEYERCANPERDIDERIKDYFEFHSTLNSEERKNQAARCMDCGVPVADKHHFACLLHEKPFEGVNGSGKHDNWSIVTNTKLNLLDPGDDPYHNITFLDTLYFWWCKISR